MQTWIYHSDILKNFLKAIRKDYLERIIIRKADIYSSAKVDARKQQQKCSNDWDNYWNKYMMIYNNSKVRGKDIYRF